MSLVERLYSSQELIGKSSLEIIPLLPTFLWRFRGDPPTVSRRIVSLSFAEYNTSRPRRSGDTDILRQINIISGALSEKEFCQTLAVGPGREIGIISLVQTKEQGTSKKNSVPHRELAHLPLIDIDINFETQSQSVLLEIIKKEIQKKTEVSRGVILDSGVNNHFHFIGLGRVLDEEDFVTFLGACLNMRGPNNEQLVDAKWVGHALTPMKYSAKSVYYDQTKFATLRVTTNERKPNLPVVVAVL